MKTDRLGRVAGPSNSRGVRMALAAAWMVAAGAGVARAQGLDWLRNPANGHWYAQSHGPSSWSGAQELAQHFGARLVTVRSPAESGWLDLNFFSVLAHYRHHWIGLRQDPADPAYAEPAGGWGWASGEPVTFLNWAPGQPDNAGGRQDFARSGGNAGGASGLWHDDTDFARPGFGGSDDWYIASGQLVVFDTSSGVVQLSTIDFAPGSDAVNGVTPVGQLQVSGGVVELDDLVIEQGGTLLVEGPNAFIVMARGRVVVRGLLEASGVSSSGVNTLNTTHIPEPGAPGRAGGGRGGVGSPLTTASSPSGGPGDGAFGRPGLGGQGGETGWSNGPSIDARRGAGGGGGVFGPDRAATAGAQGPKDQRRIGLDAEAGFDNLLGSNGALNGSGAPQGGAPGASPFVDGLPDNDFYGRRIDRATGALVFGELLRPWAGAGGGGGGDAAFVPSGTFPAPFVPTGDEKGSGGGGGGGSVHVLAQGHIAFGVQGQIRSRGGLGGGGENTIFLNRVGGGSGGGSGGHVVLQSARYVDFRAKSGVVWANVVDNNWAIDTRGGQGGAGKNDLGGAMTSSNGQVETLSMLDACAAGYPSTGLNACRGHVDGAGGDGGPGLVQLHTPRGTYGTDPAAADILLPAGVPIDALTAPTPVAAPVAPSQAPTYLAADISAGLGLFELISPDCDGNGEPDAYEVRFNPALDLDGDGVLDACDTTVSYCFPSAPLGPCETLLRSSGVASASAGSGFELVLSQAWPQRAGLILYGLAPTALPQTFGVLCVAPPTQRLLLASTAGTPGACDGELRLDWNQWRAAHPMGLGAPFAAGQTLYAQAWTRFFSGSFEPRLSNGHRFTLSP